MRLLSLICVIVVLVLNLVPCADMPETADQNITTLQQHSDTSHDHPFTDTCSPFCHCSCCANSSIVKMMYLNSVPFTEYSKTAIPYIQRSYLDLSLPIWQPPQWS